MTKALTAVATVCALAFATACHNPNTSDNKQTMENIRIASQLTQEELEMHNKWTNFQTRHQTLPFNEITTEEYLPAMRLAMKIHKLEVQQIAENTQPPTFENTVEALEASGQMLSNIQYCFYNLLSAETNDQLDSIANEIAPEETEHNSDIYQNPRLFARVREIWQNRNSLNLTTEQNKLLEIVYEGFEAMGATLPPKEQEQFKELNKKLSSLTLLFQQNVLKATNDFELRVSDESRLAGLPQNLKDEAKTLAQNKQYDGWIFTLKAPCYMPFMKYAEDEDLRRQMYTAYNTRATKGDFDNIAIIRDIAETRLLLARLLGYQHHAEKVLRRRMAENTQNVYNLLDNLLAAYKPAADAEVRAVSQMCGGREVQPWDWSFYSQKVKERDYQINDEEIKQYLPLESVKQGVFGLATRLYGLTFTPCKEIQTYHSEVEAYEVKDESGNYIAVLYTDFFPREGKSGGAWMTEFKPQWIEPNGENSRPHISIVMNFTRPTETTPSLLTFDELTTFLHEFGHALHGMLANSTYASLSGTNVYRDFVELPSQLMENWALEKEYLDSFARHYQTHEPIHTSLVEKIRKAANFNCGYATLRQLSFGYLDMAWHTLQNRMDGDIFQFEDDAWAKTRLLPALPGALMSANFTHIFSGGYSAGYYGYKWAEVLDADAFAVFKREGIFNRETARRFRTEILEKGGSEHPMTLYKRFKGAESTIDALLQRNGIKNDRNSK